MAEVNYDKLVKLVKGGANQASAAKQLGVTVGQLGMVKFCQAQVDAGIFKKAPATASSVKKLRDGEGNRWELIAARIGSTVGHVKDLYEQAGGNAKTSYTGRGQKPNGSSNGRQTAKAGKASGRGKAAKGGKGKGAVPRARTRAERAARGNPS